MIALDTNILVHAHRIGTDRHREALSLLRSLSTGTAPYALFWPSLYEFLRVVTHRRVFDPPSTVEEALEAVSDLLAPPVVRVLMETERHALTLDRVLRESRVTGNLVHDAHLVALAIEHGVDEILTLDADFEQFRQVASRNPFASRIVR
ncbi:MAG: TA system VapC family ribonuclease toxin [Hyphomicrobiales bacterium]